MRGYEEKKDEMSADDGMSRYPGKHGSRDIVSIGGYFIAW